MVITDIRNGVFTGKMVIVHDTQINFNGCGVVRAIQF